MKTFIWQPWQFKLEHMSNAYLCAQVTEAIEFPEAIEAAKTSVDSSDIPAFNDLESGEPSGFLPNTKVWKIYILEL